MSSPEDVSRDDHAQHGAKRRIGVPSVGSLLAAALVLFAVAGGWWVLRVRTQIALVRDISAAQLPLLFSGRIPSRHEGVQLKAVGPAWLRKWVKENWLDGIDRIVGVNWPLAGDDDLRRLAPLRDLKSVALGPRVTDAGLETLSGFRLLESVVLIDARSVTRAGLRHLATLPRLEHLWLNDLPQLTDDDLEPLSGMVQLKMLSLSGPGITDRGLEHLARHRRLEWLRLDSTAVRGDGLRHLAGMTDLEILSLDGTQVDDDALRHLAALTALRHLNLDRTKVTDAGLKHLAGLSSLESLSLDGTRVMTDGVKALSGIPRLHIPPLNPPESRPE